MPTSTLRRVLFMACLAAAAILAVASPVMGVDSLVLATAEAESEEPEETAPGAGTEAPAADAEVPTPAVAVEPAAADEDAPEWTFRFLLPTALVLGGVAVVGTTIAYFVKVTKARYRVVE